MSAELERLRQKVQNYPSPYSYNRLAELLIADGDVNEAETVCRRAIREFPRNAQCYMILADIEKHRENYAEVQKLLHKAVTQDPRCIPAHLKIASFYRRYGHNSHAEQHYEIVLSLQPGEPTATQKLALLRGEPIPEVEPKTIATVTKNRETDRIKRKQAATSGSQQAQASGPQQAAGETGSHLAKLVNDEAEHDAFPGEEPYAKEKDKHETTMLFDAEPSGLTTVVRERRRVSGAQIPAQADAVEASEESTGNRSLHELAHIDGVKGTYISDNQGRVLVAVGFADDTADLLAALSHDVDQAAQRCIASAGIGDAEGWHLTGDQGQSLCYRDNENDLELIAVADPSIKIALLELRAKQALQEMGQAG